MFEETQKIWILGGKAHNADRSIPWQKDIPNLSNCDSLIIDLNTRPPHVEISYTEIRDFLRYMIMAGKTIYVIISPSSVDNSYILEKFLPFHPKLIKIKPCQFENINGFKVHPTDQRF